VSAVFKTKLRPRFVGPFTVVVKKDLAYTLNLPKKMRTHPVFYVGLLKPYRDPEQEGPRGWRLRWQSHSALLESQQQVELTLQPRQALLKALQTLRRRVGSLIPLETLTELADLIHVGIIVRPSSFEHPLMTLHRTAHVAQRLRHPIHLMATDRLLVLGQHGRRRRCSTSRGIATFM
jgi:hypothetical protein